MTSGMGAFLVFIDNKTDMGVLALMTLALLGGFLFLRYVAEHDSAAQQEDKKSLYTWM
jgi:hypothetical protein